MTGSPYFYDREPEKGKDMELLKHNQNAYEEIKDSFQKYRKVLYVSGVGTGKSFVFLALAENVFKGKILYVVPKHSIAANINAYKEFAVVNDRVDFATYNTFSSIHKGIAEMMGHCLVVIDECHHLGSDIYGKNLIKSIEKLDIPVLGLTATPERDDHVSIENLFDVRVDGISNFDAIRLGLMPSIEYRVCYPEKDFRQIEKEYEYDVKPELSYEASEDILRDAITMFPRNKWIAFFPDVKTLHKHEKLLHRLFPGYQFFTLYASLKNLPEVIDGVQKAERAVVLSVNILLEGVHLPNINGILLMRNVTSLAAFQQMIGRVCGIGNHINPVVLDCSACSIKLMAKLMSLGQTSGAAARPSGDGEQKEIVKVGIGAHKKYDINRLFYLSQNSRSAVSMEHARQAVAKYRSFNGKIYKNWEELKTNDLDNKKFRACCRMYHVVPEFACRFLSGEGEK